MLLNDLQSNTYLPIGIKSNEILSNLNQYQNSLMWAHIHALSHTHTLRCRPDVFPNAMMSPAMMSARASGCLVLPRCNRGTPGFSGHPERYLLWRRYVPRCQRNPEFSGHSERYLDRLFSDDCDPAGSSLVIITTRAHGVNVLSEIQDEYHQ